MKHLISYGTFVCLLLTANLASAQVTSTIPTKERVNFCTRLEFISTKTNQNLAEKEKKLSQQRIDNEAKTNVRRINNDKKLADRRNSWDENRALQYEKMMTKRAKTETQKSAVAIFKQSRETAVKLRRTTIDNAIKMFHETNNKLKQERQAGIDLVNASYKTALQATEAKAKANCATLDPSVIKKTFYEELKVARTKLETDRKAIHDAWKKSSEIAIVAHKTAYTKAISEFKNTMETAWTDLKNASKKPVTTLAQ